MTAEQLARQLVIDHDGNYRLALIHLAASYLTMCACVSAGYIRLAPDQPAYVPASDPPAVCDDDWVRTARE